MSNTPIASGLFRSAIFAIILGFMLSNCQQKPDVYINGKPYYIHGRCVKSHKEEKTGWYFGYDWLTANYDYHYGDYEEEICDETVIDTIEIK